MSLANTCTYSLVLWTGFQPSPWCPAPAGWLVGILPCACGISCRGFVRAVLSRAANSSGLCYLEWPTWAVMVLLGDSVWYGAQAAPNCISVELSRTYNWTCDFMLTTKNRCNNIRWTDWTWWNWMLKKLGVQIGQLPPSPLPKFETAEWFIKVWLIATHRSSKVQFGHHHSPCQGQLLSLRTVKAEAVTFSSS